MVCLAIFLLLFVGRTLHLRISQGINPLVIGAGKNRAKRVLELAFVVVLLVWSGEVLAHVIHLEFRLFPEILHRPWIDVMLVKFIGAALNVVGLVFFAGALVSLGGSWRVGIDSGAPGELVTCGFFSFTRNPTFIFIGLYFIGTFLINGTAIFLLFAMLTISGLHLQILKEEKALARIYGQRYREYCTRVGRYFPARIIRFQFVAWIGTLVNMGVLWVLKGLLDVPLLVAGACAIELAIVHNFTWHYLMTWRERVAHTAGDYFARLLKYNLITASIDFVVNLSVLYVLTRYFGVFYLVANLIGMLAGPVLKFLANEFLIFRHKSPIDPQV